MSVGLPYATAPRLLPVLGAGAALLANASAPWALGRPWLNFWLARRSHADAAQWRSVAIGSALLWNLSIYWLAQWFIAGAAVRPRKA